MSDTTTTLNAGTGGDIMDETSAYQADGSTLAKRPRVEIALACDPGIPKLVGRDNPLPVSIVESKAEALLQAILEELIQIKHILGE